MKLTKPKISKCIDNDLSRSYQENDFNNYKFS